MLTGGSDGRLVEWTVSDGSTKVIQGKGHGTQINGLNITNGSNMASVGIDDTLKTLDQISGSYNDGSIQLKAQPRGLDHKGDLTVVTTSQSIVMVIFRKLRLAIPFFPSLQFMFVIIQLILTSPFYKSSRKVRSFV